MIIASSLLRPKPDYGENPHNGSDPSAWLKYAALDVQPEEDAFFQELAHSLKKASDSQFLFTSESDSSTHVMPHTMTDPYDSGMQRLDQDLPGPTQGLAQNVMKMGGVFDDLAKEVDQAATTAQQASQKMQQVQQQTSATSQTTPTQTTPQQTTPTQTTPQQTTPTQTPPAPSPQSTSTPPPGPKPTATVYTTKTSSFDFDPDAFSARSMSEAAHQAFFQSNPYMTWNQNSPLNPAGQYNDMNYNPRPSYFEEGTGDSSFSNLHNKNNGNYERDTLNFGGVTDMLPVRPADPRFEDDAPDLRETLPMTSAATPDPRTAALSGSLDEAILRKAQRLSTEDNPYIRDYSEVRPLNNILDDSVNKPEQDPNDPKDPDDSSETLHRQPMPRYRAIGPQGLLEQFDPNQQIADPFIETVSPASADGTRFSIPSYKTKKPCSELSLPELTKDH